MKVLQVLAATFLLLKAGPAGPAQQQTPIWAGTPSAASDSRHTLDPRADTAEMRERLEKARQSDRQRRMIADTKRLLNLAAELKAETQKTSQQPSSSDAIRKAEEIEKLARSVKDRMKG